MTYNFFETRYKTGKMCPAQYVVRRGSGVGATMPPKSRAYCNVECDVKGMLLLIVISRQWHYHCHILYSVLHTYQYTITQHSSKSPVEFLVRTLAGHQV